MQNHLAPLALKLSIWGKKKGANNNKRQLITSAGWGHSSVVISSTTKALPSEFSPKEHTAAGTKNSDSSQSCRLQEASPGFSTVCTLLLRLLNIQ